MSTKNTQLSEAIFSLFRIIKGGMLSNSTVLNLTMVQLQALFFLKTHNKCQMNEIATHFKIELPSATSLVNKLVTEKLATRKTDPKDRRIVRVTLTAKGEKLLTDGMKEREKKIEQMLSFLSEKDSDDFLRILQTIISKS